MLAVAGVVLSQTGLVSTPLQGQLLPDDGGMMGSSEGFALPNDAQTSPSNEAAKMSSPADESTDNTSEEADTLEIIDCSGIKEIKKALCINSEANGRITCSDIAQDCKDSCIYPWPILGMCESSCRTEESACLSQVVMNNITCVTQYELSYEDCKEHNAKIKAENAEL